VEYFHMKGTKANQAYEHLHRHPKIAKLSKEVLREIREIFDEIYEDGYADGKKAGYEEGRNTRPIINIDEDVTNIYYDFENPYC